MAAFTRVSGLPAERAEIDHEIRRLAWPAIAEMVLHMFVWIVDTAMVGRLGDRAVEVGYRSLRYSVGVMASVAAVFLLIPGLVIRMFTNDPEVIRIASLCLRIAAFEQVFIGMTDTLCGSLRGAGDTRTALRITAAGTWLVRMPLIVLAIYVFHLGLPAVWVITGLDWAVRSALAARHFRAGRWQEVKVH